MGFQGRVALLTGSASTGKSTLAREAQMTVKPLHKVDFGQLLLELKQEQGYRELTYDEMRSKSATIITPEDVKEIDRRLIEQLPQLVKSTHVLIDSHAVTKESFGYRITHYSFEEVQKMNLGAVIVTYCLPEEMVRRHLHDPQGRPKLSVFEAQHQMALQESVAINYSITCGCPCYLFDTGSHSPIDLAVELRNVFLKIGAALHT